MKYLLDTDTCIALLRGNQATVDSALAVTPDDLAISSITRYELRVGVLGCPTKRRQVEARKVNRLMDALHEIPFTSETAEQAATIRHQLLAIGQPIGPMDTLIAATALEAHLTLVTGNLREFGRIKGLSVVNWM